MTRCPFCGREVDRHTNIDHEPTEPNDGDCSICFRCGKISIFVLTPLGIALVKPTADETAEIESHPIVQLALRARAENPHSAVDAAKAAIRMMEKTND